MISEQESEPTRNSHEWHARECEVSEQWSMAQLSKRFPVPMLDAARRRAEEYRDRAAKLRRADQQEAELKVLREYALEGDGIACEYCPTVCIAGADDSEEWGVEGEEGDTIHLCYVCSEKEKAKADRAM